MTLTFKDGQFLFDDQAFFLQSGEIHYFRIKRDLWVKHLVAAKEAGLNTVSTYVPWAWHEYEEGKFDFTGVSSPERDLVGWLESCKRLGINAIVKPGPFILAEFRGAGLPDWFMEKFANDVKMRTKSGEMVASDGVNLFNKIYLEKVSLWYDNVLPLISKMESHMDGSVIMMQICNEIGVFSWLAHQADYGGDANERFAHFLQKKYNNIAALNAIWDTKYAVFEEVELPPDGRAAYQSRNDRARDHDWHAFWRVYYGDYLRMLTAMARQRGITVPMYHNLPGWIYGNGYEFPVNITMYEDLFGNKSDILFGVDHIPEFQSYRNLHDDRIINDITAAMQGNGRPLFAAEFQCGSREYHVETNPREMALFYKASVANGLKGWNFYMFSQGKNPPRKGYSGDTFYWFNPLTPSGERTPAFDLVKKTTSLVKTIENQIVNAERKAEICVLFYPPYYATELERPLSNNNEIVFHPSAIRRSAYFDGLLKVLQLLNVDYDMADLNQVSSSELLKYKQIWTFSTDEMDAFAQKTLVDYAENGGKLIVFPQLPDRQLSQEPCTILRDAVGISKVDVESTDSALIDVFDLKDIKCANPQIIIAKEQLHGASIIAKTINGSVCGFEKNVGKGMLTFLGAWMGFDTEGHKPVYEALLKKSYARLKNADTSDYHIIVRERFATEQSGVLFIGNYYNEDHYASVQYTHPASGEQISLPYHGGTALWPGMYSVLTPLMYPIGNEIFILHTTSDLLEVKPTDNGIQLIMCGDRDLQGEIVFEGDGLENLIEVEVQGAKADILIHEGRKMVHYTHRHHSNIKMNVVIKS